MSRPSELIRWANCQLRAYESHGIPDSRKAREIPHIAGWVGTAVHAQLSLSPIEDPPVPARFDTITPNVQTAKSQVARIVEAIIDTLADRWWRPFSWEVKVGTMLPHKGTIDAIIDATQNEGGFIIADVKTGRVSHGVWLQLGSYVEAIRQEGSQTSYSQVAVVHAPRTSLHKAQTCDVVLRDAEACRAQAVWIAEQTQRIISGEMPPLPSPGYQCSGCGVGDCAVRANETQTDFLKEN